MREIKRLIMVAMAAATMVCLGCEKEKAPEAPVETTDITYTTLNGCWELTAWNGEKLIGDTFCYIEFNRTERSYEMWSNFGSMYGDKRSGTFTIAKNDYGHFILSGVYDYGVGDWEEEYRVVMDAEASTMSWEALTTLDTYTYTRIAKMPEIN